jgi:DNA-binding NarL/FixJ family response regulator
MRRIRLLLVDDHEVLRMGLRSLFMKASRIRVVGEAGSVADAVKQVACLDPDVVLLDLRLPDGSGIEACRRIRATHPQVRVLFLTSFQDEEALVASTKAGASGFIMKQIAGEELIRAVETIAAGGCVVDPTMTDIIVQQMRAPSTSESLGHTIVKFPPQQQRVLALLAEGKTNREIAAALSLSERTVIGYVRIIFRKLRMSRRSQVAVYFTKAASSRTSTPSEDKTALRVGP